MRIVSVVLTLILVQLPSPSRAESLCFKRSIQENFSNSSVVVAASATGVSIREVAPGEPPRQTILWRVSKSWKGPYRKGSIFTTRNRLDLPITRGNAMLLFLTDREPYSVDTYCSNSARLEDSLDHVPLLEELASKSRESGT